MKEFLKKIGSFFSTLFTGAKKAYDKLPQEEQEALLTGSGVIAIINDAIDDSPTHVLNLIKKKFPKVPADKVLGALNFALTMFNIDAESEMERAIDKIQAKLRLETGKGWAFASEGFAKAIAIFLAPKEMKYARVGQLIEFVYQTFFKKKK